ncbi:MAG: ATP-dependent DNA helicase chl1 [Phylliscum demangeonii]|nr:MAG: ATP-dependent DNA helicase chl1 [Phylliscum demangeonii]
MKVGPIKPNSKTPARLTNARPDEDEPAWIIEHAKEQRRQALLQRRADLDARLAKIRARERKQRERFEKGEPVQKRLKGESHDEHLTLDEDAEAQFVLDDYDSGEEGHSAAAKGSAFDGLSTATKELMSKLGMKVGNDAEEELELEDETKVFYCSRTHSQLGQFISELRRVKLPPAIAATWEPGNDRDEVQVTIEEEVKHLTLGSRKNLCINAKVSKLGHATAINERCLDLQQPGTPKGSRCQFLPNKENEALVNDFRDHALAHIRDIEELGNLGKRIGICPYYAARSTVKPSEIVTLPYPLLLQRSAREALGLSLKGHIVIIDEAHNLMDTINSIYSISVSLRQFKRAKLQLNIYLQKFRNRLKGKNRVYVTQVLRVLDSLTAYLESLNSASTTQNGGIVPMADLMAGKGVDQVNLYKLMRYLQESKLARKVEGYTVHVEAEPNGSALTRLKTETVPRKDSNSVPVLTHIQGFLLALTNPSAEGRIFYTAPPPGDDLDELGLKYMLLDPTHHFQEIVEEARSVILAGGTMSPMSDYINHLLGDVPPKCIRTLSCGHVIPPENLVACALAKGPSGQEFEFTFAKRNSPSMIDELGRAILNLCLVIPDGVVVFFPSYAYLDQVVKRWVTGAPMGPSTGSSSGPPTSIWDRIGQRKQIFQETRDTHLVATTGDVLSQYAQTIALQQGGALLLAVIGGKLSEGINFSDALGRAVLVVGLPYPNAHSAEWKAKLEHIEQTTYDRVLAAGAGAAVAATARVQARDEAKQASRDFYENACMRAVNQSVGRAIRHRGDYACILLADRRFRDNGRMTAQVRAYFETPPNRPFVHQAARRLVAFVGPYLFAPPLTPPSSLLVDPSAQH